MLLISDIVSKKKEVIDGLRKRNFDNPEKHIEEILLTDQTRRNTQTELDAILAESNQKSKMIGGLMKAGQKDEAEKIKEETALLKTKAADLKNKLNESQNKLKELLYQVPNIPHELVPAGNSEEDNIVVSEWGESPVLDVDAIPHWELIKKYDIIDFDLGIKITGAGFPVYKGKGAKLERSLINFFLDEADKAGYTEILPPIVINEDSGYGTGQLPDKEGQMYEIQEDKLFMIPTAEVPITNLYRNEIMNESDLPVMNVGYTPCFRREAGSWGAHVRGLNRLHQFDKVEIVQINKPELSYQALDKMCEHVKGLIEKLNLKYRVLRLCGGDLGFTSAITYDMEVFSAAQKRWLEVSSVSNFETYQANRLKLRYRDEENKTQLLHTLNGSALALPRIMAAILENNQTPEGIMIPEALIPYTGFDRIS